MREAFREGETTEKVIKVGFDRSWTAIWDSHITSLTSAVILYIFGISMIKGF
jgi:preprotein translocase subunit SecD